jgi:hypothetical protein
MDFTYKNTLFLIFLITAFFIFNPLIILVIIFTFVSINYENKSMNNGNKNLINLCCILSAIFMGCINMVKGATIEKNQDTFIDE